MANRFIESLKETTNVAYTANGALSNETTMSECLDFFATVGAARNIAHEDITLMFERALAEDRTTALRTIFYARDVREGLGERKVFRICLRYLGNVYPEVVRDLIKYIPEYGRWDDLLALFDTPSEEDALKFIKRTLSNDLINWMDEEQITLLAKWLPSINTSNKQQCEYAKRIAKYLGWKESRYRRTVSALRQYLDILENRLRTKDYTFDYSKQPSKAMFKYKKAFIRNDKIRYKDYLNDVDEGKRKLNTKCVYPYEIANRCFVANNYERKVLDTTWNNLPAIENNSNSLVVMDGSGSMYMDFKPRPADVALSLAIYFAEHCKGAFHNHFITFGGRPKVVEIKGNDISAKVRYCSNFDDCMNTDLMAVFIALLETAVKNNVPSIEMPETLYIISDMEFDAACSNNNRTAFQVAKEMYENAGYKLPKLVFWRVNVLTKQLPVKKHDTGTVLVSGCSPMIFNMVLSDELDPYGYMMKVLGSKRYEAIGYQTT